MWVLFQKSKVVPNRILDQPIRTISSHRPLEGTVISSFHENYPQMSINQLKLTYLSMLVTQCV
jgi:hypothetical protein